MAQRPVPGRAGLFSDRRGSSAISHLALCGGLFTLATVVVTAVDPSAQEAASHLGDHLVGVMGGRTTSSPESDRAALPYRPNRGDVNYAAADPSEFTGDFGQFLADQARYGSLGRDSFKSADGTVPKQVQVAGLPFLVPALATGGGATAGGAAAGGTAAGTAATAGATLTLGGLLAWFASPDTDLVAKMARPSWWLRTALGITNAPPEVRLLATALSPTLLYGGAVESAFVDRQQAKPKVLATYPDELPDLTKPVGGALPEQTPPVLATYPDDLSLDQEGFTPSGEPGVQILTNEAADVAAARRWLDDKRKVIDEAREDALREAEDERDDMLAAIQNMSRRSPVREDEKRQMVENAWANYRENVDYAQEQWERDKALIERVYMGTPRPGQGPEVERIKRRYQLEAELDQEEEQIRLTLEANEIQDLPEALLQFRLQDVERRQERVYELQRRLELEIY